MSIHAEKELMRARGITYPGDTQNQWNNGIY